MATIHDIAKLANCSARTVSRVLNNSGPVAIGTREKIETLIQENNFQPNMGAQALRNGKKRCIGLIQNSSDSEVNRRRTDTLTQLFSGQDYSLLIHRSRNPEHEEELIRLMKTHCDALIIFTSSNQEESPEMNQLQKESYPFIVIDPPTKVPYPSITIERSNAYRDAVLTLAEKGRKNIALIVETFRQEDRIRGYKKGLEVAQLSFDPKLIIHSEKSYEGGVLSGRSIINQVKSNSIDAILCHNDRIALGIMRSLINHEVKVPEQVSIIGFDNDAYGAYISPSLSSIDQGKDEVGTYIYEQLYQHLDKRLSIQSRTYNTTLIIRESI
ncbi:MAG: LacI family DNA-binding transcriptional regulator [Planctomycetes bacterium]|nr:LacI family DNA-binding transcriptional regulator [Planctomycetota bacterium]